MSNKLTIRTEGTKIFKTYITGAWIASRGKLLNMHMLGRHDRDFPVYFYLNKPVSLRYCVVRHLLLTSSAGFADE